MRIGLKMQKRKGQIRKIRKIAKYTLDSMRPHTHTHDVRHTRLPLTSNRTEPRSRSPSCAKRVYVTSPKRHTRHGSCARTARSSQRTQDRMWFDLSSQTATQSRHAECMIERLNSVAERGHAEHAEHAKCIAVREARELGYRLSV